MVVYANHLFVMIYQAVYQNINELIHLNHEISNLIEIHNMEILPDNVQESIRKKKPRLNQKYVKNVIYILLYRK